MLLTTVLLVAAVRAIRLAVASLRVWYTGSSYSAMHVTIAAVGAILFIGKIRAIDHAVANPRRQSFRLKRLHASYIDTFALINYQIL